MTTTKITCTKSEFSQVLAVEFVGATSEMQDVIDGLVRQANAHRGVFTGHSAYLDLDFTVTPDDPSMANCAVCGGSPAYPARNCIASFHDSAEIVIPAVTGAQRDQAHRAAYDTAHNVGTELLSDVMAMALSPDRLEDLGAALYAAAGHLRIADGEQPKHWSVA